MQFYFKSFCIGTFLSAAACLLLPAFSAEAVSYTGSGTYDNLQWSVKDAILCISGTGDMTDSEAGAYPWSDYYYEEVWLEEGVTSIGAYAFSKNDLVFADLPSTLTEIGKSAFADTSLTQIRLPDAVTTVGAGAFSGCESLSKAVLSQEMTEISDRMFAESGISQIQIPQNITAIGSEAFYACSSLETLSLGDQITQIGNQAFSYSGLTSLTLPDSYVPTDQNDRLVNGCENLKNFTMSGEITYLPAYYFDGCVLHTLILPDALTEIAPHAFSNCWLCNFNESVAIPESVTTMGEAAFESCCTPYATTIVFENPYFTYYAGDNIEKSFSNTGEFNAWEPSYDITVPDDVTEIPDERFSGYTHLHNVTLPESLQSIGARAFSDSGVHYANIPKNVAFIGEGVFDNCKDIWEITFCNDMSAQEIQPYFETCNSSATYNIILPDSMESIPDGYFKDCANLGDVTIPETVKTIEAGAFQNTGIRRITIPETVEYISPDAFQNCKRLLEVTFCNSIEEIPSEMFVGCEELRSVTLPDTVTSIGDNAFAGTEVDANKFTFPENLQTIGKNVFPQIIKKYESFIDYVVTSVDLPDSVVTIYDNSFPNLWYLGLGSNFQEILHSSDISSLQDHPGLMDLQLSEDNPYLTLKNGVLYSKDMTILYEVAPKADIPDGVVSIPKTVTEIRSIIYSDNVKAFDVELGNPVYSSINGILTDKSGTKLLQFPNGSTPTACTIPSGITTVGAYAFYRTPLQKIKFPASVTTIEDHAFANSSVKLVMFADGLQTIGEQAFYETNMKTALIPASVTTIGSKAFQGSSYEYLTFLHPQNAKIDSFAEDISDCTVFYGYAGSPVSSLFSSRFELLTTTKSGTCGTNLVWTLTGDTLTISGSGTMKTYAEGNYPWSNLEFAAVQCKGSGITIAPNAFSESTELYTLDLTGVTTIGEGAFRNCTNLMSVTGSSAVNLVKPNAFAETPWLDNADQHTEIGKGLAALGSVILRIDQGASEVIIPDGTAYVTEYACRNLTIGTLYVPQTGVYYHASAFENATIQHVRWNGKTTDISVGDFKKAGSKCKEVEIYDTSGNLVKVWGYTKDNSTMSLANALCGTSYMNRLIDNYCTSVLTGSHCNAGMTDAGIIRAIYQHIQQNTVYGYSYIEDPNGTVKGKTGTWSFCNSFTNNAAGPVVAGRGVCSAYTELVEKMIGQVQQHNMSATLQTLRQTGTNHVWNVIGLNTGTSAEKWYYLDATNGLFLAGYENPRLSNNSTLYAYTSIPKNAGGTYTITVSGGKTVKLQGSDYVLQNSDYTYNSGGTPSRGDINGDNSIDTNDAYLTLTAYAKQSVGASTGFTDAQLSAMDVDQNGSINTADAYYILCYYARSSVGADCSWDTIIA
ncbi:leucine-rich repeat protein [uncultured Ruminococcus sp.]|uniref:leucine-rich repeat protein n=1 Tax=uncultured Ruminococcus sp. TaxID=165186 RepID=UPI00261E4885|nr:leucine-rich repeat protein [uncultured Ruminococcus sp.]